MNVQMKSFVYQCWSYVRVEVCAALETGNTNQMTAVAMVMGRVKGG